MLSFLSQHKNSYSDHKDYDDDHNEDDKEVQGDSGAIGVYETSARSYSIPVRFEFDAISTDTIDYADVPTPRTDEKKGILKGDDEKNGEPRNGVVVRTPGDTMSDKQRAENIYSNGLKFLLSYHTNTKSFYMNVTLIVISLFLQVAVGVSLIVKKNLGPNRNSRASHFVNQFVVIGIFLVTVINVIVARRKMSQR